MKKKLVLKIGSSTLTAETDKISRGKIEDIARQIVELQKDYEVILVSSGAIATAKQFITINGWNKLVESKQAMAAVGQPLLMQIYNEVFRDFGIKTAQCLMTYRDFEDAHARENTLNTLTTLIRHDFIPIVNENDTVAIEEIMLGDNDKLSALVATLMDADLLVLASDIDGLFDKNPHLHKDAKHIPEVTDIDEFEGAVEDALPGGLGTGGMASKLQAARICREKKIEMWIVNGGRPHFIVDALAGKIPFTKFTFGV
jgi:glutamate 5-kinase